MDRRGWIRELACYTVVDALTCFLLHPLRFVLGLLVILFLLLWAW